MKEREMVHYYHITIPPEVWSDNRLTLIDRCVLSEVDHLDRDSEGCWASNEHIAKALRISESSVSNSVSKLKELGLIKEENFDGRKRFLKSNLKLAILDDKGNLTLYRSLLPKPSESASYPVGESDVSLDTVVSNSPSNTIENIQMSNNKNVPSPAGLVDVSSPKPYTSKVYDKESLPYKFAEALIAVVSKRRGTYNRYLKTDVGREKLLQNNSYSFDLLLRKDKKDVKEVLDVLTWSQEDDFWKNNILSADKFRLQYDRLLSQMQAKGIGSSAPDPNADFTKKLIDVYRALIHNPGFNPSPLQRIKFIEASKKATEFFFTRGLENQDPWDNYILRCLSKNYVERGETIFPGHFCSTHLWEVLMPQYLSEVGL